jgi:NADH-quinone oxidoreductase subunit L
MDLIWLIPVLPGIGAAVNGLLGIRYFSRPVAAVVACLSMGGALVLALIAFWQLLGLHPSARMHEVILAPWFPSLPLQLTDGSIGAFEVPWGFRLDPLSGIMILVVTGIGFLIHVYASAYMHDEPPSGYARFFCYLNLFCFFMLLLVLGSNFLVMFVGWEGVGLCSYLLIGYYYERKSASDAGKKAFITNRIGDWGFILGIFLAFVTFGSLDFNVIAERAAALPVEVQFGTVSLICLLLFIGATAKSAQIPLYVWLPDAMEGPTPVSALIHAATMVTAGVYMVGRNAVLFSHAPIIMEVIAVVGVLTALVAASIALVQNDIKRVLAYSTVSQLGFMFAAMGLGAFAVGIFHLMTHAFFKALLFLCSGSVIHAMAGEQDMNKMGGLKKHLPITYLTMLIGALAIAGIPPLAGFFSKDEILLEAFINNRALWVVAVLTALMTAFYMFRLIFLTFYGAYRGPAWTKPAYEEDDPRADQESHMDTDENSVGHGHGKWNGPHESPPAMTAPLMALAIGVVVAGLVGVPSVLGGNNAIGKFLEPSFSTSTVVEHSGSSELHELAGGHEVTAGDHGDNSGAHHISPAAEIGLMLFSVGIGMLGIFFAYRWYVKQPQVSAQLAQRFKKIHRVLTNKYYVDEAYNLTVIRGTMASARNLWAVDRTVVDGAVNGTGAITKLTSWVSALTDKTIVDGAVNTVGRILEESSHIFRRVQTGLIQNYALLMLFGVFTFVTVYLFVR